mgnify:CR=1 FL=1
MDQKGYIYTLEVMMAILVITIAATFLFGNIPEKPQLKESIIKERSFEALEFLDDADILRQKIYNQSDDDLEGELEAILPINFLFNIDICTFLCDTINIPGNNTVISIDYYVSTYRDDYTGQKIKMWVWTQS